MTVDEGDSLIAVVRVPPEEASDEEVAAAEGSVEGVVVEGGGDVATDDSGVTDNETSVSGEETQADDSADDAPSEE